MLSAKRAPYVKTKPIHHSQKVISDDENGLNIELTLIPNRELVAQILSFGDDVKVLEPEELRKEVSEYLEKAYMKYKLSNFKTYATK